MFGIYWPKLREDPTLPTSATDAFLLEKISIRIGPKRKRHQPPCNNNDDNILKRIL